MIKYNSYKETLNKIQKKTAIKNNTINNNDCKYNIWYQNILYFD